jgi:predicted RNA binding protein YcfA (HicA-like mRNA interferase family)
MNQPKLKADEIIKYLSRNGFSIVRQKGSHVRMRHNDGRVTSVPHHPGQDIGKGLLKKILRDTDLTMEELLLNKK